MTIHTLHDLCYAYNVADPVRDMLFALQDRITELEAQKLQDRNAMDAMKMANEQWTQECRRLEKQLVAKHKPLTHIQAKELVAKYGNDPFILVYQTERAHNIKEGT